MLLSKRNLLTGASLAATAPGFRGAGVHATSRQSPILMKYMRLLQGARCSSRNAAASVTEPSAARASAVSV